MTLSDWLQAARKSQAHPDTGKPWSQAYTAKRITEETGKTLYREALNGYEKGKGMEPETYRRLVAFWAGYGVKSPPALDAKPDPFLSLEERAVLAAERQAAEAAAQTELMGRQVALLERLAGKLTGPEADPSFGDQVESWGSEMYDALALARRLRPSPAA